MTILDRQLSRRRGAIAALAAILMIPAFVLLAFLLSLGQILVAKAELQKAADSAALAGASQILTARPAGNPYSDSRANDDITKVVNEAQAYSILNSARGVNLSLLKDDVVVGYMENPADPASDMTPWTAGQPYPNVVKVTVRRDKTANKSLPLFLTGFLGLSTWNGSETATACASRTYNITGFDSATTNAKLLPLAIDVKDWKKFQSSGKSPDGIVRDDYTATSPTSDMKAPCNVSQGFDKIPEYLAGPNWCCIGEPSNNVPTMRSWIDNGAAPSDLASFGSNGLQIGVNCADVPGSKDTLMSNLQNAAGQPRVVILYDTYTEGNYHVVGFAGVSIVATGGNGSSHTVTLQPMAVIDPTAITSGESWKGSSNFVSPMSPLGLIR